MTAYTALEVTLPNTDKEITSTSATAVPEENEGLYAECSMATLDNTYAAIEKTENEGLYVECSMATLDNTYAAIEKTELQQETEQVHMNADNATTKVRKKQRFNMSLACIFASIAAVVIVMTICIAFFSLEICKLKAQTAYIQQSQQTEVIKADIILDLNSTIYSLLDSRINRSIETILKKLSQDISVLQYRTDLLLIGQLVELPASSCATLLPTTPSGYYWVSASNGSAVRVYCDMTRSCGGVTGGWVRVGYLDMTNSSHQCPSGFTEHSDSKIRTCRRTDTSAGCGSVLMDVLISIQESVAESEHIKSVLQMHLRTGHLQV